MPQDLFATKSHANYWDDEAPKQEPVDLFELSKDPSTWEKVKSGLKQNFASIGNSADTAMALAAQGIGQLVGMPPDEKLYEELNQRIKLRNQWAGDVNPGLVGKVAGALNPLTLPASIASIPFSAPTTGKEFIDAGETLPNAYKAMGIDSIGNVAGFALPVSAVGKPLLRAATGAGMNAAQDTLSRLGISGIAETKEAKDLFAPTIESATVAAIPGAAFGAAFGKAGQKNTPKPAKDIGGIVASEKTPTTKENNPSVWERTVMDLGGEIPPKETPFSGMIEALTGKPRIIDPDFKMAPEEVPYVKRKQEAAADDDLVARLQAAVDKQNPAQPPMMVDSVGGVFPKTFENVYSRDQAGIRQAQENADSFNRIARELPQNDPLNPNQTMGWHAAYLQKEIDAINRIRQEAIQHGDQQRAAQAQALIETRQRELEQSVARQTSLDNNAAARDRQERASTGAAEDQERLRQLAEQRQPGNNTPMEFEQPYPVDINTFPQTLKEAPYPHENGIPYDQPMLDKSLPVEVSDTLGKTSEPDPFNRFSPTQNANRILNGQRPIGVTGGAPRMGLKGRKGIAGGSAPMINDLAHGIVALGAGIKAKFTGVREQLPDTLDTPRSESTIAAKQEKRAKAAAVGIKGSAYENIKTKEEALANLPEKDIGSVTSQRSGNEAIIRTNTTNGPLKFVRGLRTQAQTNTDALTAKYITGQGGFNETFRKLSGEEKMEIHQVIQELSNQRVDYSDALADKLGLSPAQRAFMESRGRALNAVLETANTVNKGLGFELIKALPGYSPGMFASTYVSLVGHYVGEGAKKRWVTEAVVNANSKWEYEQGLKYYKDQGKEFVNLDRRGLNSATKGGRTFDGTMKLLSALAEKDSRFAEAKDVLDNFIKDQTKKLYNFDKHELRKKGVEGNIGNKPWLTAERNAKEGLEAEVNYIDEAFRYWNYQEMLNKTKELVDDPKMEAYPNTRKYLDKYIKQVTGNNLHPIGAGANSFVDFIFKNLGTVGAKVGLNVPENPNRLLAGVREAGSALLMNVMAPLFFSVQMGQMLQSGLPESMKIRNELGLSPDAPVTSLLKGGTMRAWFATMNMLGKLDDVPNSPMKEAYIWMREHGIDHYNEIQMSHEAAQNPTWTKAKNLAFWPTRLPEMLTRPTVFMWYADMFHQAGLRGDDLHYTAKNATDYAMVNYHPDERPMMYQQMGVLGQGVGALKTYPHNAIEQMVSRTKEMKQNPAAFLTMLGFTGGLMGIAGLPFYDEIDQWFIQPVTGKSGRDWMGDAVHPALIDGVASWYKDIDLQSRFSMADMVPGSVPEALAGAPLTRMWQVLDSAFGYIKNQDTQSFNELAKAALPSGVYGAYEDARLTDNESFVLNKEGERKYATPRTQEERNRRKYLGLRPLRERLEDEDLYTTKKLEKKMTDKQREAYGRMRAGLNLGDSDGFQGAMNTYLDLDGDPKAIEQLVKRNAKEQALSERQRQIMAPGKSVSSVKKYERYWEE